MKAAFYITNHGYGHASRNVAIIQRLYEFDSTIQILIKSDAERCGFIKRNLALLPINIQYWSDCSEVGLVLKTGTLEPDISYMEQRIAADKNKWTGYIEREKKFLKKERPDVVIADIICWAIVSAKQSGIKTILIGNFSWASMYKSFYPISVYKEYLEYYKMADLSIWYEIHDKELETYTSNMLSVSLVSRKINPIVVKEIKEKHKNPIIFVSLGASAEIAQVINVSYLPYDFITTRGINLIGENVFSLPLDMINTQDYIAASEYVIAKGGWSTVAEILLQKKRCCLLRRGHNTEDKTTQDYLEERQHCVIIDIKDLLDIRVLVDKMKALKPKPYTYYDSTEQICNTIRDIKLTF